MKKYLLALLFFSCFAQASEIRVSISGDVFSYTLRSSDTGLHSAFFSSPRPDYTKGLLVEIFDGDTPIDNKNGKILSELGLDDAYLVVFDKSLVILNNNSSERFVKYSNVINQIRLLYPNLDFEKKYSIKQSVIFMNVNDGIYEENVIPVSNACYITKSHKDNQISLSCDSIVHNKIK